MAAFKKMYILAESAAVHITTPVVLNCADVQEGKIYGNRRLNLALQPTDI